MNTTSYKICGGGLLVAAAIFATPANAATFDLNLFHVTPTDAGEGDIFSIDNLDFGKDDEIFFRGVGIINGGSETVLSKIDTTGISTVLSRADGVTSIGQVRANESGEVVFNGGIVQPDRPVNGLSILRNGVSETLVLDQITQFGDPPQTVRFAVGDLAADGNAVFQARKQSNQTAIFAETPDGIVELLSVGDPFPGLVGQTIIAVGQPSVNDAGDIAVSALASSGASAILEVKDGVVSNRFDTSQPAPLPSSPMFAGIGTPDLNNTGAVALFATLQGDTPTGISSGGPPSGIFLEHGGLAEAIIARGDIAPDAGGLLIDGLFDITLNDENDVGFLARLSDGSTAAYFASEGNVDLIVKDGDQISGFGDTFTIQDFGFNPGGAIDLNDASQIALSVRFDGGRSGFILATAEVDRTTPVPLPAGLLLLISGIAILGLSRRYFT